jgi:hypothetical protein
MKFNPIPLITICLLVSFSLSAQQSPDDSRYRLQLQSGSFIPEKNIVPDKLKTIDQRAVAVNGKSFAILQFENIPNEAQRRQLQQNGIELLEYIPANAYTATITGSLNPVVLQQNKVRAIVEFNPVQKMHPALTKNELPAYAVKVAGTVDVWISFPKTFSFEAVSTALMSRNFDINATSYKAYRIIGLRVAAQRLQELASLPVIEYVQPAPGEPELLNNKSTTNARANVISYSLGRNLNGQGVVIGVGDNADPNLHIDFAGRLINRNPASSGNHGLHVMGTAAGAGIMNEKYMGYAPKATILAQLNMGILNSMPAYVQDHGMVITNNSYGLVVNDCESFGFYDLYSRLLDQQASDLPHLQNVFAAGNSGLFGSIVCTRYANGFGTVLGAYQSAKNVVCVGNTTENDSLHYVSSRGPVRDGRIKPDIAVQGRNVWSAGFGSYWPNTGTSMASPGAAGGLALLYQHYRQLHGNADPKNGLMKALLCNGATDLGAAGPDYSYGFGWMNLLRSAIMLEKNNYFTNTIATGNTNNQVINVPANTAQLKVMLYWNDTAASVLASHTLVNDLDLEVIDPSSNTHLPFILDTLPANITDTATTGVDHINNIEQVVILNPPAGNYTLRVKGTAINQNPVQEYFLVFDTIPVSTTLTYPIGKEKLFPGDSIYISWDAWGGPANTFTLEYLKNNAASWATIDNNVAAGLRQYKWFVPSGDTTDQAKIRITRNATAMVSTSDAFTILGEDTIRLLPVQFQCEGYIRVNWTTVNNATDYEPMILRGDEMIGVGITTDTFYTFSGLSKDSVYWVSVRPRLNGNPGRRAVGVWRQPNTGGCAGTISDNDLTLESIISPASSGRLLTSTALSNSVPVTIRIKNLDDVVSTADINVSYSVNGGAPVTAVINGASTPTSTIAAGASIDYTFSVPVDMSAIGTYSIEVIATRAGDAVSSNNSRTRIFKQLANPAITLPDLPLLDDFESTPAQSVMTDQMGLDGRDRYDFVNSSAYGRIRTFVNTGIAYSGTKALTLDVERFFGSTNVDSLTATYNLAAFDTATDDIRLDFRYKNHGQDANGANKVWIRGSDVNNWIQVYDLYANQPPADGTYKFVSGIEMSDSLISLLQNFSTSFQVRWGQYGQYMTADNETRAGYTFDDIRLYRVTNDIQMVRIDTPVSSSCALSNAVPVRVTVRNTASATITNIPVVLRVDGNIIATETIPSIAGNTTIQYTFSPATANLSANGNHVVEVWAELVTDTYRLNDTAKVTLTNSPVITSFPYLENFEAGVGSWYTSGKNSSWQYGTPASVKMKRAASGSKAWKTTISGFYNDNEFSYLYSPCFDISGMTNPSLSLSLALDIEDCGAGLCDGAWVEYSTDGITWLKLGAFGQGTNWYNKNYSGNHLWSKQDYTRWHVATTALPTTNNSRLRLRFVFNSDAGLTKEGMGIDDIHIYDNVNGIYDGVTMGAPVNQNISGGTAWIDFTSGGKLVASVQPNNQVMGSTDVQAYIHTGAVRNYNGQYYHNRNITIKPATTALSDSAVVRFYFLDTETEALIAATGCGSCTKPSMAYELGVSKYSDPIDALEDGDVTNSLGSYWTFINATRAVKVPFDKGYYAEFKVKDFSEFWLNNGGFTGSHPLPVQLTSFTAVKTPNRKDVLASWTTASEFNVDRFEIEIARGTDDFSQNRFVKIGEVASHGNATTDQHYSFTDIENNKSGVRYYRLKSVDLDGRFSYSAIRPVVFSDDVKWQVYPNPSAGMFNLLYQLDAGQEMKVRVYDASGRTVYQVSNTGTGFMQKINIDLGARVFASGLYLIEAEGGDIKQSFKVFKN